MFNSRYFMKISSIRRQIYSFSKKMSFNKQDLILPKNPDKPEYVLLRNIKKGDVVQMGEYGVAVQAPKDADTFSLVLIGKKDNPNYKKEIMSFFSKDKIIKRTINETDNPPITKEYTHDRTTLNDFCVKRFNVVTKFFNRDTLKDEIGSIEHHKIYWGENSLINPVKRNINHQVLKNVYDGDKLSCSISEFTNIGKNLKKVLGLVLKVNNLKPEIIGTQETINVKLPSDDKFLPFRFILDKDLKCKMLAKFFIKEKGLEKLNTRILFSNRLSKNTAGYFSDEKNAIIFNSNLQYEPVDLAAHEVEHAYQYAQIGRIGKGYSDYFRKSERILGDIKDFEEIGEAQRYAIALEKYPNLKEDEDLGNNVEYMNNYLEVKAREAGKLASQKYEKSGRSLWGQFFFSGEH